MQLTVATIKTTNVIRYGLQVGYLFAQLTQLIFNAWLRLWFSDFLRNLFLWFRFRLGFFDYFFWLFNLLRFGSGNGCGFFAEYSRQAGLFVLLRVHYTLHKKQNPQTRATN